MYNRNNGKQCLAFDAQKRNTEDWSTQGKEWGSQRTDERNPDSFVSLAHSPLAHPAKILAILNVSLARDLSPLVACA
jgi:hypothetical protein